MENIIEREFECQICLDLLVEPTTTICGHTFCKVCLIKYLNTKLNCPICRKPILQSKESLSKNVVLENLIKSSYKDKYEERLKSAQLFNNENNHNNKFRNNLPFIHLKDCFIWPKIKRRIEISDLEYENTLNVASINDRCFVLSPFIGSESFSELIINQNSFPKEKRISCIVEILSITKRENKIYLEILGLKRFLINEVKLAAIDDNQSNIFICNGEIISDIEIHSPEILDTIKSKLLYINNLNTEMLQHAPYSIINKLEHLYGKSPMQTTNNMNKVEHLEPLSFYFLNLISNDEKIKFYMSSNIIERVDWLLDQYEKAYKHKENASLIFHFYDLHNSNGSMTSTKTTIFMILLIIMFLFAYKFKLVKV